MGFDCYFSTDELREVRIFEHGGLLHQILVTVEFVSPALVVSFHVRRDFRLCCVLPSFLALFRHRHVRLS